MHTMSLQQQKQQAILRDTTGFGTDTIPLLVRIVRMFRLLERKGSEMKSAEEFYSEIILFPRGRSHSVSRNDRAFESYFIQAQRVRRLIQYSFDDVFSVENVQHRRQTSMQKKCDIILCPTTIGPAPRLESISSMTPVETYVNDVFTVPASLAGLPAISIPVQVDEHIVGLQLLGQVGTDALVLEAAKHLEQILSNNI